MKGDPLTAEQYAAIDKHLATAKPVRVDPALAVPGGSLSWGETEAALMADTYADEAEVGAPVVICQCGDPACDVFEGRVPGLLRQPATRVDESIVGAVYDEGITRSADPDPLVPQPLRGGKNASRARP